MQKYSRGRILWVWTLAATAKQRKAEREGLVEPGSTGLLGINPSLAPTLTSDLLIGESQSVVIESDSLSLLSVKNYMDTKATPMAWGSYSEK